MNYPRFVAQQLPIGLGAIESIGKSLIEEREKGAGMRWTEPGAQAVASLRALHRSGDWRGVVSRPGAHAVPNRAVHKIQSHPMCAVSELRVLILGLSQQGQSRGADGPGLCNALALLYRGRP